jgi:hypothetical protein
VFLGLVQALVVLLVALWCMAWHASACLLHCLCGYQHGQKLVPQQRALGEEHRQWWLA